MGELRQLNEQNKLAIWAERVTECRNSGQSVLAWCKEHGICSQTYYKWQKRLFSVGKTAIVNVDPPPSPLQRKQGAGKDHPPLARAPARSVSAARAV